MTPLESEALSLIRERIARGQAPPSCAELANQLGIGTTWAAHVVKQLERQGAVKRERGHRAVVVCQ